MTAHVSRTCQDCSQHSRYCEVVSPVFPIVASCRNNLLTVWRIPGLHARMQMQKVDSSDRSHIGQQLRGSNSMLLCQAVDHHLLNPFQNGHVLTSQVSQRSHREVGKQAQVVQVIDLVRRVHKTLRISAKDHTLFHQKYGMRKQRLNI